MAKRYVEAEILPAYHAVSAFVAENQITLGEIVVEEKSNEITTATALLELVDVGGSMVTADAMHCQKEITKKISDNKVDYVIGLKENQCTLYHDAALYFRDIPAQIPTLETLEKDHGRMEKRTFYLLTERAWEYECGPIRTEWAWSKPMRVTKIPYVKISVTSSLL